MSAPPSLSPRRVALIGGGLAGACAAWALARRGCEVTLFERDRIASGASGAAVGALQPLLGMRLSLRSLNYEGFLRTSSLVRELLVEGRTWRQPGVLRLALQDELAERWSGVMERLPAGLASWKEPADCRALEPRLSDRVRAGVWIPEGKFVDIPALIGALLSHADARVYEGVGVRGLDASATGVSLTLDSGERACFDEVVVCSGAQAPEPLRGESLTLAPYMGVLAAYGGVDAPRVALSHRGYISAWRDGSVLVGTVDRRPPFEDEPSAATIEELRGRLEAVLGPQPDAHLLKVWCGVRPALADHEPVVRRSSSLERAWIFTGFGGRGLLMGPLLSESLAAELCGA